MTPPDLIAALDAQIERYQIAREVPLELGAPKLLGPAAPAAAKPRPLPAEERPAGPEEPPPGKSDPRPPRRGPGPTTALADQIVRAIADRGPMRAGELAPLVGATRASVSWALSQRPDLFRKQPGGLRAPWELTEKGRETAAG